MKHVFLVGSPRSGTTWTQMLLAQHPRMVTTQEAHMFGGYLGPLRGAWERDRTNHRGIGVQTARTEEELDGLCAGFASRVLAAMARTNPDAEVVLEKTPTHMRHAELILKLLPGALFVHLVRDPRAVVASLCAAGRSWSRSWASTDPVRNVRRSALTQRPGSIAVLTQQHTTVECEEFVGPAGPSVLEYLFHRMGLEAEEPFCRGTLAEWSIDRLRNHSAMLKAGRMISREQPTYSEKTARVRGSMNCRVGKCRRSNTSPATGCASMATSRRLNSRHASTSHGALRYAKVWIAESGEVAKWSA